MASILSFVRKPVAAPSAGVDVARLLEDFSIEVMPRTAAKIEDFRAILPEGTRVYVAHIDGTRFRRHAGDRPPPDRRGLRRHAAFRGAGHRRPGGARNR